MRRTLLALALLLGAARSQAAVEIRQLAVFADGRLLEISATALLDEDTIRLELPGGGSIDVPLERLDHIVQDAFEVPDPPPAVPACVAAFVDESLPAGVPFSAEILAAARAADLHPLLVAAVVEAESASNPRAVSRVGARGLMQLMPAVWRDERVADPFDPAANLAAGCRHLRRLIDRFGDLSLALAAYNAGPATVERYAAVPPYRETRGYLKRVLGRFCPAPDAAVAADVAAPSPTPASL